MLKSSDTLKADTQITAYNGDSFHFSMLVKNDRSKACASCGADVTDHQLTAWGQGSLAATIHLCDKCKGSDGGAQFLRGFIAGTRSMCIVMSKNNAWPPEHKHVESDAPWNSGECSCGKC